MSKRVFKSDLSTFGIMKLRTQLHDYADDELLVKAEMVVRLLADDGIRVAEYNVYDVFRPHIDFIYRPVSKTMDEVTGEMVGKDNSLIHRVWYSKSGRMSGNAYISPMLMSEFGAGPYALAGHRGTFPGQKNAFRSKWFWYDESGHEHSSEEDYTMIATQPMYRAYMDMVQKADRIVRQVFGA